MAEQKLMKAHQDLSDFGNRILTEARTELYIAMRFMGRALDSLGYTMDLRTQSIGTDARTIHYNPTFVFHLFIESPQKLDRLYLHIVLHCIFRHMFTMDQYEDEELWGLAADIQVESVLDSMDYDLINRPAYPFREQWYERLKAECKVLTAERIYHYLSQINLDFDTRQLLIQEFHRCDHQFWQKLNEKDESRSSKPDSQQDSNPDGKAGKNQDGQSGNNQEEQQGNNQDGAIPPELMKDMQSPEGSSQDNGESQRDSNQKGDGSGGGTENSEDKSGQNDKNRNAQDNRKSQDDQNRKSQDGSKSQNKSGNPGTGLMKEISKEELDDNWKDTAERLKTELETFGADASDETGSLAWVLAAQYRKETDFREFIRKLTIVREETRVDPDSFDYGYYNYGMEVYGNMPLIEENEFCEDRRISDLVIAIDTSASTKEDQVQKFLNETAAMLRNRANFFKKIRVHILECDDQVQRDVILSDPEEIEEYAENFQMKGGYGTDFRPVFKYVEELRKKREIPDMKGMLYFTDGYGEFPDRPTDYETAFVFDPLADINDKDVPDWAMKLYIKD